MQKQNKAKEQQPEALAQLAKAAREDIPGGAARVLIANEEAKHLPAKNTLKHKVAKTLLATGARGEKLDPRGAGERQLHDRTRSAH